MSERRLCILIEPTFKLGDPAPTGYMEWHAWARVQLKAGGRQRRCRYCGLWRFPQEVHCTEQRALPKEQAK